MCISLLDKRDSSKVVLNMTTVEIYKGYNGQKVYLPLFENICAGFPSPAEDFIEQHIDLNEEVVKHPSSTFYGRVSGTSMIKAGIRHNDIIVIDKSIEPKTGKVAVCFIDGKFTLKKLLIQNNECFLMPENDHFKPIKVGIDNDFKIWGIATHALIHL